MKVFQDRIYFVLQAT